MEIFSKLFFCVGVCACIYALLTEAWTGSVWKGGVRRVTNTSLIDTPDTELILLEGFQTSDLKVRGIAVAASTWHPAAWGVTHTHGVKSMYQYIHGKFGRMLNLLISQHHLAQPNGRC